MSQNAIVKETISNNVVRVSLLREMECGSGCKSCEGCSSRPTEEILALATDPFGVNVGDWVEVESNGTGAIGAAMLIYLLPCITLLVGYVFGDAMGMGVNASLGLSALGLVLGFLPARMVDRAIRNRDIPEFSIIKKKQV